MHFNLADYTVHFMKHAICFLFLLVYVPFRSYKMHIIEKY